MAYAYTYALREAREKAGPKGRDDSFSFCQFFQRAAQEDRRWCPNAVRDAPPAPFFLSLIPSLF